MNKASSILAKIKSELLNSSGDLLRPDLEELLVKTAIAGLEWQGRYGEFPAGKNGPHNDNMTPVRNTANWLVTITKAFELSNSMLLKEGAQKAIQYLVSRKARTKDQIYFVRKSEQKLRSNGLIGQSVVAKALLLASTTFDDERAVEASQSSLLSHPFDQDLGLWSDVEIEGKVLGLNPTLNQQIHFASSLLRLSRITHSKDLEAQVRVFLDKLPGHLRFFENGRLLHHLAGVGDDEFAVANLELAQGYHLFAIYAASELYRMTGDHPVWLSPEWQRAKDYLDTHDFKRDIASSRYGFGYAPVGFEMAIAIEKLGCHGVSPSLWIKEQLRRGYDFKTCLMTRSSSDPETQAARFSELVSFLN